MKTLKASAKRFRVTGTGKIIRRRAGKQHLLAKKNNKRKLRLSKMLQVDRSDYNNVIGALPYLKRKWRTVSIVVNDHLLALESFKIGEATQTRPESGLRSMFLDESCAINKRTPGFTDTSETKQRLDR
ncbi:hypothetical protein POM88_042446 [Heracleum sosnowskyi]|uniref:50S ribosomal protein L35 n=1 Tax=Heracleum sosnowskyi TaxID=360622 RepID=A0AAD8M973_9APIA|nr:hypothetical protein POM88_042446 [Heracleum sosnowskyi]